MAESDPAESGPPSGQRFSHWPSWPVPFAIDLQRSDGERCPYLEQHAMRVRGFACEAVPGHAYQRLLDAGFRRSGKVFYQPACSGCRECVPLRVAVARFVPSRSQRRVKRRNADLRVEIGPPAATDEKHDLYTRYLVEQHDGAMATDRRSFEEFLCESSTETIEIDYRDPTGRLLGLGICDLTPLAVSTVYFASDPDAHRRSLGTYSSLVEIDFARTSGRPYYYLGYWVASCPKMRYKNRFRGCEVLSGDGVWRAIEDREVGQRSAGARDRD